MGVDAQREGRVTVAEVFGELLDGDTASKHDAGVVVTELVDTFLTGSDIAAATTAVPDGCGDQASLGQGGLPDGLGVATSLDVLVVRGPAEQDAARMRFPAWLFPGKSIRPGRIFLGVPSDGPRCPSLTAG